MGIMSKEPRSSIHTRKSLLSRLKDWGDEESWRTFFDTYWKLIYDVAMRSGLSDVESQDVVQETVISVAKKIPEFNYDPKVGSFKNWLRVLTRWRIMGQFRKRAKNQINISALECIKPGVPGFMERVSDPEGGRLEALWDEEWRKNILEMAQDRVKRKATPKDYQIFDLWVMKKSPARDVARSVGVNLAHVYVAKHRVMTMMKKEVQALESRMNGR
jgi:RNA polymerase sigma-70 factor (ECF subfamily)